MKRFTPLFSAVLAAFLASSTLGCQSSKSPAASWSPEERAALLAEARTGLAKLDPQIARLESAAPDQLTQVVHELGLGDAAFEAARRKKAEADKALIQIGYSHLPGHPEHKQKARLAELAQEDLAARTNWMRYQRKRDAELLRDTVARLKSANIEE